MWYWLCKVICSPPYMKIRWSWMDNNNCCSLNGLKKKKRKEIHDIFFRDKLDICNICKIVIFNSFADLDNTDRSRIDKQLFIWPSFKSFWKKKKLKNALSGKKKSNVSHNIKQNLTSCVKRHFWNLQMDFTKTKKLTSSLVRICKTAFSNWFMRSL